MINEITSFNKTYESLLQNCNEINDLTLDNLDYISDEYKYNNLSTQRTMATNTTETSINENIYNKRYFTNINCDYKEKVY